MKTFRIYQVDAFTRELFKGNPAGVVANADGLTDSQMQAIARELNNAETAFVLSPGAADHDVWIRFFTPTIEVPVCGHATVSAHYVRALEKKLPSCTVIQKTGAGILPVDITRDGEEMTITMTQGEIEISEPLPDTIIDRILSALGLCRDVLAPGCPIEIASTGHSKVMIGIIRKDTLDHLAPDMNELSTISRDIGCNGFFVFTLDSPDPNILTCGRMFAPAIGIHEDPVTGNANGPLGAYLVHHGLLTPSNRPGDTITFQALQGEAMGRPGIIRVMVDTKDKRPVKVRIQGEALVAFQTEITL